MIGDGQLSVSFYDGTTTTKALHHVRHGNDASFVVGELAEASIAKCDPQLLALLKDVERVKSLALSTPRLDIAKLALRFGRSTERTKRLLRLASLSTTIVTAILESQAPSRLTNRFLQNLDGLPLSWAEQERLLLG